MNITDITLFNRYVQGHDHVYQRTYLYKVLWDNTRFVLGSPASYTTRIEIPYEQTLYYRPPIVWHADRPGYWTLQLEDVIVKGIIDAQINTVTEDMYQLYTLTDLRRKFELVTIVDISQNRETISQASFQVGAS